MSIMDLMVRKNRVVFNSGVTSAQRIKSDFLSNFWNWVNLFSADSTNSLVDFLIWLGCK